MTTIKLDDGKYEFDIDDATGLMTDARRNGEHWDVGMNWQFSQCFISALWRIRDLEGQQRDENDCQSCVGDKCVTGPQCVTLGLDSAPATREGSRVMDNKQRAAFEAAYIANLNATMGKDYIADEMIGLREGDSYGDRAYLNGCWWGWQVALVADVEFREAAVKLVRDMMSAMQNEHFWSDVPDIQVRVNALLTGFAPPPERMNVPAGSVQYWLADIDANGNPKLSDGAHSCRENADKAAYLHAALGLQRDRVFAVARVELLKPRPSAVGVNHEAVAACRTMVGVVASKDGAQ